MKRILIAFLCALTTLGSHAATSVAGVTFADTSTVSGNPLVLNGAGLRKKFFFDVYAAGLYLPAKASDSSRIISADVTKRIDITLLRNVSAEKFVASLQEGLQNNQDAATLAALKPRMDAFSAILLSLKEAREGQRYQMDYVPGKGTQLLVDGNPVGDPIAGADFYGALLSVWIGEHPAQTDLKAALLGQ